MLDVNEPNQDAYNRYDLRKHITKVVELLLEGCRLGYLRDDAFMNVSDGGGCTRQCHYCGCMACDYSGTREQHVDLVLFDRLRVIDSPRVFTYTLTFPCQDSLVNSEVVALNIQEPAISWYPVPNSHFYDISRDEILGQDPL